MGNIGTPIEVMIIAATLIAVILLFRRSDPSTSRRYARIRVQTDERRRGQTISEPQEEEFDPAAWMEWFIFGSLLLVIVMMLGRAI